MKWDLKMSTVHLSEVIATLEQPTVSGRYIYNLLGLVPVHWARWARFNIENNAEVSRYANKVPFEGRAIRPQWDFELTSTIAKHLLVVGNSEIASQYREHIIQMAQNNQSISTVSI